MDLLKDYVEGAAKELRDSGVSFDESQKDNSLVSFLVQFIEFKKRRIARQLRAVSLSKEIEVSPQWAENEPAVKRLMEITERGEDLWHYQTKNIRYFDEPDLLFSDWGIHHLHLGNLRAGETFSGRTDALLYALFLPAVAYFLAIMDHSSFSEIELLEILEANWPGHLDRYTIKGLVGISPVPSSEDVRDLRKAGALTMIQLRSGRILYPPGGGYSTAKTSIACMNEAQYIVGLLRNAEAFIMQNERNIRAQLGFDEVANIRLAVLDETQVVVMCTGSKKLLRIPVARCPPCRT